MKRFWERVQDRRLQVTLILSFSLVAAVTIVSGMVVTLHVIRNHLNQEAVARVRRAMMLGQAVYGDQVQALASSARRAAALASTLPPDALDSLLRLEAETMPIPGNRFLIALDAQGQVLGRTVYPFMSAGEKGYWGDLPVVAHTLRTGYAGGTTEVIPAAYLRTLGLDGQAFIAMKETPKAAPQPFDPREGEAGLVLVGIAPIIQGGNVSGAVLAGHLLNNDFTLVDRIKAVGQIDTVTIFFGDLRVSTNVMTEEGERAIGTRISKEVRDVVLERGQVFEERAFVVHEWYITRYDPLYDHQSHIVGSLYVGMREAGFLRLVSAFNERISLIAFGSILMAFLIAVPLTLSIVRPLARLVEASQRVAQGDMSVRVPVNGRGELATLARSFNEMIEALSNAREELIRKEKLASVGQLAAGVAHEINNPLGTILLYADTMRKELPEDDPRQVDFEMIIEETMRCKHIVSDLLNFARQRQLTAKSTDVNALLRRTLSEFAIQPDFRGIEIVTHLDPNLPLIEADESQIRQVFTNLIDNAGDAMEGRGRLTVTTRHISGDGASSGFVEISFQDTGIGIPEEHLKEIFTPFFTTKPVGKGTGLGLSIVYGIVKMHQGQITVQSRVGEGTKFTVTLPVKLPGRTSNAIVG